MRGLEPPWGYPLCAITQYGGKGCCVGKTESRGKIVGPGAGKAVFGGIGWGHIYKCKHGGEGANRREFRAKVAERGRGVKKRLRGI